MRRALLTMAAACTGATEPTASEPPCPCAQIAVPADPVTDETAISDLLASARREGFPDLEGVQIGIAAIDDLAYFRAWTELETATLEDGRARTYTVQYDPVVLAQPMPPAGLAALLVHELAHIHDYVAMGSADLVSFALWYGTQDPSTSDELRDYERATDEAALIRGCADGLSQARVWIYDAAADDPAVLADKQRNYYTPEEIDAWRAQHGECAQ